MKSKLAILIAAVLLFDLAAADFELVKDRQPKCSIVLPEKSKDYVAVAAWRFNRTLKTITGTTLPVVKKDVPGNRIVFTIREADSLMTIDNYTITFPDSRTMQIECTAASVQWAFNHIIREFAKAEWILPETCGLSYTPMKDLTCPTKKVEVKNISWAVSRIYNCGTLWPKMNYRMGLRIGHDLTHHAFPFKKYSKDNSWPAAVMPVLNGKKITSPPSQYNFWQPCYSNPETAKIAVENLLEYLKAHPGTLGLSMGCNDNRGYCECAACMKLDKNNRYNRSESYFTFINRVLTEVCKKHPKLLVSVFAYDLTYLPPSFKLHPNAVVYLTIDINSCIDPKLHARHKKLISEWGSKASMLGVWDYSWGYPYPAPRLFAPYHLDMLKFCYDNHAKGYYGECWVHDAGEGPKQYLISKLLWDSNQDMKKLEEEWYVRCVGKKAVPYLKAYYKVWNDYFTGSAVKRTPWFKSAPNVYMTYPDLSSTYGLEEKDLQAAGAAMKRVVELAGTAQEKARAELLMRHWRYTLLRLRMLGSAVYDPQGTIRSKEQALKLLDIVKKYPEYQKEYQEISDILTQDPALRREYLNPYYLRVTGTPVRWKFDQAIGNHILAASAFAGDPEVSRAMTAITQDPNQLPLMRQLCKALANPALQKNLLPGGNAEKGIPDLFEIHPELRRYGELSISEKYRSEGKKSFLISVKGHDTLLWIQIPAKPFKTYLATFKAFIKEPSAEGYMETNLYAQKKGINQQYRLPPPLKLSGGVWQTFSVLTSTRDGSDSIRLRIHLRNFDKGDEVFIDDIRIMELGDAAAPAAKKKPAAEKKPVAVKKPLMKPVLFGSPEDFRNPKVFVREGDLLLVKGRGIFFSAKTLDVDPAGHYHFSVEYRTRSGSPVKILTGFVPLDGNGKAIPAKAVSRIPGTETKIAATAEKGSRVIKVADASAWNVKNAGFIALNAKDDFSDLPNPEVLQIAEGGIRSKGKIWEITLKAPLGKMLAAGTKVRQHSNGSGSYIWNPVWDYRQGEWCLRCSKLIGPAGKPDKARYAVWPGMKKARFVLLVNGKADSVTELRNIKVTEVKP